MFPKKHLQSYDIELKPNAPTQTVDAVWLIDGAPGEPLRRTYTTETILECVELAASIFPKQLAELLDREGVFKDPDYAWREKYFVADMREVLLLAGRQLGPTFSKYGYGNDSANAISAAKSTDVLKRLRNSVDFTNDREVACAQLLQCVCDFQNHAAQLRHDLMTDFLRKIVELTKKVETLTKSEKA